MKKNSLSKIWHSESFSLIILLYLTKNWRGENEMWMSFLQSHGLRLEKLNGKMHNNRMPFFAQNANYIICSHQFLSDEDFVSLSHLLLSKVTVLSFFYKGRVFNASRLKLLQPSEKKWPSNIGSFLDHQNF